MTRRQPHPVSAAQTLARQASDFTAEGAPPAGALPAAPTPPPKASVAHGPAQRKRWLRAR